MIDIDYYIQNKRAMKAYSGVNGNKISINIDDDIYMVKYPIIKDGNVSNSSLSEHIGSNIFNMLGIKAQETFLAKSYVEKLDKELNVVICKDFEGDDYNFYEFSKISNSVFTTSNSASNDTNLENIYEVINNQSFIDNKKLLNHFWDTFVVDAFIGNFDRHNSNWGLLVDKKTNDVEIAPIYDCGSSLYPRMCVDGMKDILDDKECIEERIYVYPTSAIKFEGEKINYFDFINSLENKDCNEALLRMYPIIDDKFEDIKKFVMDIDDDYISDIQREMYVTMLSNRKDLILEDAYNKLVDKQKIKRLELFNNVGSCCIKEEELEF